MTRKFSTPLNYHGPIVAFLYWVFGWLRCILPYFLWFKFAEFIKKECIYDSDKKKSKPVWQDIHVLIIAILIALIWICGCPYFITLPLSLWILLDIFVYYANALRFDDLQPEENRDNRVWSHRRSVIVAVINFLETIVLFSILYRIIAAVPATALHSFFCSFRIATTFDFCYEMFLNSARNPHIAYIIWSLQICFSLFFIVIVIAILAAIGFKRKEIASSESSRK